jgi:hypothetical protein
MDKAYNKNHNGFGGPSGAAPPDCALGRVDLLGFELFEEADEAEGGEGLFKFGVFEVAEGGEGLFEFGVFEVAEGAGLFEFGVFEVAEGAGLFEFGVFEGAEGAGLFEFGVFEGAEAGGAEGAGLFGGAEGAEEAFFTLEPFPENIELPDSDSFHIPCAKPSAPQG